METGGAERAVFTSMSFEEFYARKVSEALFQPPDVEGNPPLARASRYGPALGGCSIPTFGNYHSRLSDEHTVRALLGQWLQAHGWTLCCDPNDLPVAWVRFGIEGADRIVGWSIQWRENGRLESVDVVTEAEAIARSTQALREAGLAIAPESPTVNPEFPPFF